MSSSPKSEIVITYLFCMVVGFTVVLYLLRGFGVLTFLPGGIILLMILLSLGTGILFIVEKSRRF